jgi:hydroxymethylglutaryl-CoA reductase
MVKASVQCPVKMMGAISGTCTGEELAKRVKLAVDIAAIDTYRAVTHNKGIMNGIDAVLVATGNDYRAVEAAANAYAARNGRYASLSSVKMEDGMFTMELEMPLAIGTVGGLTTNHPQAKKAFELLGSPGAGELMCIVAAAGLANNFAAVKALVSTGIQSGHMRMHLSNMLDHFSASKEEKIAARKYFEDRTISYSEVESFINERRKTGN